MPMNRIVVLDGRCDLNTCRRRIFPGTTWIAVGKQAFHRLCFNQVPDSVIRLALIADERQ